MKKIIKLITVFYICYANDSFAMRQFFPSKALSIANTTQKNTTQTTTQDNPTKIASDKAFATTYSELQNEDHLSTYANNNTEPQIIQPYQTKQMQNTSTNQARTLYQPLKKSSTKHPEQEASLGNDTILAMQAIATEDTGLLTKVLNNRFNVNKIITISKNVANKSLLNLAITFRITPLIKNLLKMGENPNIDIILNPLHLAIEQESPKMVQILLKHNADPNFKIDERTPLFAACKVNNKEIVKLLLEYNADPNIKNNGITPLYIASKKGNTDTVRLLLKYNADPNLGDYGYKPLYIASESGHPYTVDLLLKHKADPHAKSSENKTATEIAFDQLKKYQKMSYDDDKTYQFIIKTYQFIINKLINAGKTDLLKKIILLQKNFTKDFHFERCKVFEKSIQMYINGLKKSKQVLEELLHHKNNTPLSNTKIANYINIEAHTEPILPIIQEQHIIPEIAALRNFEMTKQLIGLEPHISQNTNDHYSIGSVNILGMISLYPLHFENIAPAMQFFTLLHEFRHNLQLLNGILSIETYRYQKEKFYPHEVLTEYNKVKKYQNVCWDDINCKDDDWQIYEQDADHFAVSMITCPICLQTAAQKKDYPEKGYFSNQQILQYAKQNTTRCPAHTIRSNDPEHNEIVHKLEQALEAHKPDEELIATLDKQSGSLLNHIPDFYKSYIKAENEYQKFMHILVTSLQEKSNLKNYENTDNKKALVPLLELEAETKENRKHPNNKNKI